MEVLFTKPFPEVVKKLAKMIDHTVVHPHATRDEVLCGAQEAVEYGFKCFAVNPHNVKLAKEVLQGTGVLVGTSVGYPSGAHLAATKTFEAERAVQDGADELDMVLNIGFLKSGQYREVEEDIAGVVKAAAGRVVKVIIEACYLTDDEKKVACDICVSVPGVRFIKTSTGLGPGGATVADVELIKRRVADRVGIKASGGIRTVEDAFAMIRAGATRVGTSRGPAVIDGYLKMVEAGNSQWPVPD